MDPPALAGELAHRGLTNRGVQGRRPESITWQGLPRSSPTPPTWALSSGTACSNPAPTSRSSAPTPTDMPSPPTGPKGPTVDTAHVLADGGGRELANVAMSRARGPSHVYLPTANRGAGVDYLRWEWRSDRRQAWTLQPELVQQALWEAIDQRRALTATLPSDQTGRIELSQPPRADPIHLGYRGVVSWVEKRQGWETQDVEDIAGAFTQPLPRLDLGKLPMEGTWLQPTQSRAQGVPS